MPAEWEAHSGVWLTWPHSQPTWPNQNLADVEEAYLLMIQALEGSETVQLLVQDFSTRDRITEALKSRGVARDAVRLHIIATNDSWIRDYGPNFIVREDAEGRHLAMNKWNFDSWGGKYDWSLDNRAGNHISAGLSIPTFRPNIVLEGGAIEVNGKGVCLTTESCLLNKNRNGGLSREVMESYLRRYLGVQQVIWLNGDLKGDDTDGHIDNLARFVDANTILCAVEENESDEHYESLQKNLESLSRASNLNGKPFDVVPIPMPDRLEDEGMRLPASYANFYIGNRCILLPSYGGDKDQQMKKILESYFPERTVALISSQILVCGLGSIHCITQQQPAVA